MENTKCLVGVMRIICGGAEPGSVILKRSLHKRYRDDTVAFLRASASELVRLNRALSSTERPSDKRCRTCPASRENVLKALRRGLLSDPRGYLSNPDLVLTTLRGHTRTTCARRNECLEAGVAASIVGLRDA